MRLPTCISQALNFHCRLRATLPHSQFDDQRDYSMEVTAFAAGQKSISVLLGGYRQSNDPAITTVSLHKGKMA